MPLRSLEPAQWIGMLACAYTKHVLPWTRMQLDPGYVSIPQVLTYPTTGGRTAHMIYYPPANKDFKWAFIACINWRAGQGPEFAHCPLASQQQALPVSGAPGGAQRAQATTHTHAPPDAS